MYAAFAIGSWERRAGRVHLLALLGAAGLAACYLAFAPATADLAAQAFRAQLFERHGFTIYNGLWYAGHDVPAYSVLFPPVGATLGVRLAGLLATVGAVLAFQGLVRGSGSRRADLATGAFAVAAASNLLIGRVTFALGMALALAALLAGQRGRRTPAVLLAALTALGSPLAALFLALAAGGWALATRARGLPVAIAAGTLAPVAVLEISFPEGGSFGFPTAGVALVLAGCAALLLTLPAGERALRYGVLLYAAASLGAAVVQTPVGGNLDRLGSLFALPLAVWALWPRRRWALIAVLPLLVMWVWKPMARDIPVAGGASTTAAYYAPLNRFLAAHSHTPQRVEIPFTRNHWESVYVAAQFPLARGWERQLDVKVNTLFYRRQLTAAAYHRWLLHMGVRWVALPDARLDFSAIREAQIIRSRPAFLIPAWRDAHWQVFAVRGARPLLQGPGRLERLDPDGFRVRAAAGTHLLVRLHYTPYWRVLRGAACVGPAPGGWTSVAMRATGSVSVRARFSLDALAERPRRCR